MADNYIYDYDKIPESAAAPKEKKEKKKKKGTFWKVLLIILLIALVGGLAYVGGSTIYEKYQPIVSEYGIKGLFMKDKDLAAAEPEELPEPDEVPAESEKAPAAEEPAASEEVPAESSGEASAEVPEKSLVPAPEEEAQPYQTVETIGVGLSFADIYEQNVNSTVGITISGTTNYWGYQTQYAASGSGFIVSDDGYILTNYHVIEGGDTVTVTSYAGDTYDAEIIGYDESNDIAVIKIDAQDLVPVKIGDSNTLRVGDQVLAIGNPLGELTFSLTQGIVSSLNRSVTLSGGITMSLIQTDCAINSGNSGGALFNLDGEVIGITNAKYSSSSSGGEASIDNIGFAIPINNVWKIVYSIMENGYISKPYIGVTVTDISDQIVGITGIESGAYVVEVTEDGPAAQAGLLASDIITSINGKDIKTSNDVVEVVGQCSPDDVLNITVYRQGELINLAVTVGEKQQAALEEKEPEEAQQEKQQMPQYPNGNQGQQGKSPYDYYDYFGSLPFGFGDLFRYFGY